MKIVKKIILAFLTLTSCNEAVLHPPRKRSIGTVAAKINGSEWTSTYKNTYQVVQGGRQTMFPCIKSLLYVNFELYSPKGFLRQQLLLTKIPEQAGIYQIVRDSSRNCDERDSVYCGFFTFIDDGCIAGNTYEVMKGQGNFIQIDRYNQATGEIKGKFQVTLVTANRWLGSGLSDTLRFTEGRFLTKVITSRYLQ